MSNSYKEYASKEYLAEQIKDFVSKNEIGSQSDAIESLNANKADKVHNHTVEDVSGLKEALEVQANWEDADPTSKSYIQNKPFGINEDGSIKYIGNKYIEALEYLTRITNIIRSQSFTFNLEEGVYSTVIPYNKPLRNDKLYSIEIDGVKYGAVPFTHDRLSNIPVGLGLEGTFVGNGLLADHIWPGIGEDVGNGVPFLLFQQSNTTSSDLLLILENGFTTTAEHTVAISIVDEGYFLKSDYLPSDAATRSFVQEKIAAIEIPEPLPEVTTDDNGKVLGVVEGAWAKMDAPNGGSSSDMSDLLEGVLERQAFVAETTDESELTTLGEISAFCNTLPLSLEQYEQWHQNRNNVIVRYDNVEYVLEPQLVDPFESGEPGIGVGNLDAFGGTGNGESFAMAGMYFQVVDSDVANYCILCASLVDTAPTEHTIAIDLQVGTQKIKEEYLPILETSLQTQEFLPTTTFTNSFVQALGAHVHFERVSAEMLETWAENQKPVTVIYDDVEYILTPQLLTHTNGDTGIGVGNAANYGGTGNGEPFLIVQWSYAGEPCLLIASLVDTTPTEHAVAINLQVGTQKIKEEYLPESNIFTVVVTNHGDEELTIDKSFEDAMLAAKSGKYIDAKYVFAYSSGSFEYGQFYSVIFTPDNYDVPCFEVSDSSNNTFYWTSDGISTEAPSGGR